MKQLDYRKKLETELRLMNRAQSTITCYVGLLSSFLKVHASPSRCTTEQLKQYILSYNCVKSQKQVRAMLIHLYGKVLKQPNKMKPIPNPKQNSTLPRVLSMQQVRSIVKHTNNYKHFALLNTAYCCALRVSELCNLKVLDVCFDTNTLTIKAGKGNKDRIIPFNEKLAKILQQYIAKYGCTNYLFKGQFGGAYSSTSAQKVLQAAAKRAKIGFVPTIHTLRHSRSTHLLNGGLDIHLLSKLLGHSKLETTKIYAHLSKAQVAMHLLQAEKNLLKVA